MKNLKERFDVAIATHQQGQLPEAIVLYSQLLKEFPDNAELLNVLGSALSQQSNFEDAERYLSQSVKIAPEEEGFWVNYAQHLARQGKAKEAVALLKAQIAESSTYLPAWQTLFKVALSMGENTLAAEYLRKALNIEYSYKSLLSLSQLLVRENKQVEAIELLEAFKQQAKEEASYWHALSWLYDAIRNWAKLSEVANQWVTRFKSDGNAYRFLSSAYFELGRQHDAIAVYESLLLNSENQISTDNQLNQDKAKYVELCVASGELKKAELTLESIDEGYSAPGLLNAKVQMAIFKGDVETAKLLAEQCIKSYPEYLNIYTHYCRLSPESLTEEQRQLLSHSVEKQLVNSDSMAFVMAHYHHAKGEFETAFDWYNKANSLREMSNLDKGAAYSKEKAEAFYNEVMALSEKLHEKYASVFAKNKHSSSPIFIVGMPRSGTTLLEGMLASHENIDKTGERIELPNLLRSLVNQDIEPEKLEETLKAFIVQYTKKAKVRQKAQFFIDKNPSNYMSIGLIKTLFPDALIIDIERDPVETTLSIYRHEFSHLWSYATSLDSIAHQYQLYRKFMHAWGEKTNNVIRVEYEELVKTPEKHITSLLALLGLNSKGLNIEAGMSEQTFTTFSALQVRDKIANFNGIADKYASCLAPFPSVSALKQGGE